MVASRSQAYSFLPRLCRQETGKQRYGSSYQVLFRHTTDIITANEELVAKLQSEISMEEDMKEDDDLSANIKEYLENSPFEVCFMTTVLQCTLLTRHSSRTRTATRKLS